MKKKDQNENLSEKIILVITLALIFLLFLSSFITNNYNLGMMSWNYGGYFGIMRFFGITIKILTITTLILVILWLNKQLKK